MSGMDMRDPEEGIVFDIDKPNYASVNKTPIRPIPWLVQFLIDEEIAADERSAEILTFAAVIIFFILAGSILFFGSNDTKVPPSAVPADHLVS